MPDFICLPIAKLLVATQTLPIGTAYAVWTGIGAVGTVLVSGSLKSRLIFYGPLPYQLFIASILSG